MAKTVNNVRSGPGTLFFAAHGTATPGLENVTGATFTVANWTTANYTELGYTVDGINLEITEEVFQHNVNEELGPIGGTVANRTGKITFEMAESDVDAFALAFHSGTKSTVAAGASQAGLDKYVFGTTNTLTFRTFAHLSTLPTGKSGVHIAWKVAANGTVSLPYKKGDLTVVSISFDMYEDPDASPAEERFYSYREYTANPTS